MSADRGLRGYRVQDPERTLARRREIMLAMADVVSDKGYAETTLEDVAARMGTSRAVIYYQFRNKEDLYVELLVDAVAVATERLLAIVQRRLPPPQALFAALQDLVAVGSTPINHSTLRIGRPRTLSREAHHRIRAADREYESLLRGIIEEGIQSGDFKPVDPSFLTFTLIFSVNQSFALRRVPGRFAETLFDDTLPRMLMDSLLAHPCDYHAHSEAPAPRTLT